MSTRLRKAPKHWRWAPNAPQNDKRAQVTITGNLTLNSDDTVLINDLAGTNAATQYDNFIVTGTATLGSAILSIPSLTGSYTPAAGNTITIIKRCRTFRHLWQLRQR